MAVTETTTASPELEELRARVRGEVIDPDGEAYAAACSLWNGMIERRPLAIVRCTGTADVIQTVDFAREQNLPLAVRGGGHNVAGNALCDGGVVADLSLMTSVRVDPEARTVRAAGGARLGDVDHETQAFGLATPFGVVSRTGIAGLTLHGGLGFLTRKFGFSCDHLIGADVVTAAGELVQTNAESHPDLLWALRGGGGNFGVVTSLEYRLHEVGPLVYMAMTFYPPDAATHGLRVFQETFADAPEELMGVALWWSAPHEEPFPEEWHGKPVFILAACWCGPLDQAEEATAALRGLGTPVVDMSGPMPYLVAQSLFDPEYPDGRRYYWKSRYVSDLDGAASALMRSAASRPSALSSIDLWALGGAVRREPEGGSAFGVRDQPFLAGIEANWDDPADDEANVAWARELFAELEPYSAGGVYLNFPGFGEEGEELVRGAFGEKYARLQQVKATYDPDNLFRSTFNVTPT